MSPSAATLDAIREAFMDALCEVHADARAVLARVDARRLVRADHRTGGGDVQCAVASALFHALRRSDGYRTDSTTVSCVSAMGIAREHTASSLARETSERVPNAFAAKHFADVRVARGESGMIFVCTLDRYAELRDGGRAMCDECGKFIVGGERGLWWHRKTRHGEHHDSAMDAVERERNALVALSTSTSRSDSVDSAYVHNKTKKETREEDLKAGMEAARRGDEGVMEALIAANRVKSLPLPGLEAARRGDLNSLRTLVIDGWDPSSTTAVDRRFLSVSVQAVPESWCRDAFAWSAASVRAMAFNVFLKLARPMIVRRVPLSKDNLDAAPRSARVAENASGREGVSGAAVVGRREPHPLFKTPETDTNRTIPSFPAYEPLYALTPLIDEDNAASVSSMERGLHCAYIVVASRWIVASWSDSNGEFFSIEAEPFASSNDVETNGMRWLIDRTSALSEQLSFAYGKKASAWLKFERVVICRVGPWSTTERDALARACDESFPEPLDREFLTLVEMTCVEPDDVGVRISAFASSTKNISFVTESDDASKTARTYALPPTSARESRVAFGASASSVCLRAADETIDGETLRRLCELYATRLSQLGMMCLSETAVDDFGRVRAPLPLHDELPQRVRRCNVDVIKTT